LVYYPQQNGDYSLHRPALKVSMIINRTRRRRSDCQIP